MKKLLLLLTVAFFSACGDKNNDIPEPDPHYLGRLTVTSNKTPSATPYVADNVRYELSVGSDGLYSLKMNNMRFATAMPMGLNIVIPALTASNPTDGGPIVFTSTEDPIVPYIGGKPYPKFEIPEFSCSLTRNGKLDITFTCINSKIPVGDETLDHKAVYSGMFQN